jgi:acetolactate synthase-1/2/3 large subunit
VHHPDNIPEIIRKAFKVAEMEKPGAVLIELPEDLAEEQTKNKPIAPIKSRRPGADHKSVSQAVDLIMKAKKPLILAGNGAVRKRAAEQLKRLANISGIGVVNTFMGKGAIPRTDEHCLFTVGLQGKDHILVAMRDADVIISVGYDLVEYAPSFWNKGRKKKIVHVDFWPAEIDKDYEANVDVVGDVADGLWQINEEILKRRRKAKKKGPLNKISGRATLRKTILSDLEKEKKQQDLPYEAAEGAL